MLNFFFLKRFCFFTAVFCRFTCKNKWTVSLQILWSLLMQGRYQGAVEHYRRSPYTSKQGNDQKKISATSKSKSVISGILRKIFEYLGFGEFYLKTRNSLKNGKIHPFLLSLLHRKLFLLTRRSSRLYLVCHG